MKLENEKITIEVEIDTTKAKKAIEDLKKELKSLEDKASSLSPNKTEIHNHYHYNYPNNTLPNSTPYTPIINPPYINPWTWSYQFNGINSTGTTVLNGEKISDVVSSYFVDYWDNVPSTLT